MNQSGLVNSIGNTLTLLDSWLMNIDPQSAEWQQLYAKRKHLDDQQRSLVAATIQSDDQQFQSLTTDITASAKQLNAQIGTENQIGSVITTVSQISASLDQILKLV